MSIAIRVNGRRRSQPPVGPFTMTISGNGDSSYCYVVDTDAQTPQQYYTNGDTFSMTSGETLYCYVSGPLKRVTVNGVSQTLTDNAFEYIVDSNCTIALSFTINDHSYIDITTT